jgi:crotonobetainyl-CoA:carnitine CoA-transferase CaiB-like acyl-CoA transferase
LARAQTAFGAINSVQDLIEHPQLRLREMPVNGERAWIPAPPCVTQWDEPVFRPAPALGAQGEALRQEFAPHPGAKTQR